MGRKYIIELEDENYHQYSDSEPSDYLWKVKGFNALVFDEVGISKLTPYTEPDLEQIRKEAYKKGQKDLRESCVPQDEEAYGFGYHEGFQCGLGLAWEAAKKIWEYDLTTLREIFGEGIMRMDFFMRFTASEVIEEIRAYEQAQKEKEEQTQKEEEKPISVEEVMRQYLNKFCKEHKCRDEDCPLYTSDFTCGRGYHFLTNRVSDEEVRRAYAEVMKK